MPMSVWIPILAAAVVAAAAMIAIAVRRRARKAAEAASLDQIIQRASGDAVLHARAIAQVELDFSAGSIEQVERILGLLHERELRGQNVIDINILAPAYGAYIGEAIRRSEPGARWERNHPQLGRNSYPLYWRGAAWFPMTWCHSRIKNGPKDSVLWKYTFAKDWWEKTRGSGGGLKKS